LGEARSGSDWSEEETRDAIAAAIPGFFQQELSAARQLCEAELRAALLSHRRRADELVASVHQLVAKLFRVRFESRVLDIALTNADQPYWRTHKWEIKFSAIPVTWIDALFPRRLRYVRLRRRIMDQAEYLVTRNVGNLRWSTLENLKRSVRDFRTALTSNLEHAIEATRGALRQTSPRKPSGSNWRWRSLKGFMTAWHSRKREREGREAHRFASQSRGGTITCLMLRHQCPQLPLNRCLDFCDPQMRMEYKKDGDGVPRNRPSGADGSCWFACGQRGYPTLLKPRCPARFFCCARRPKVQTDGRGGSDMTEVWSQAALWLGLALVATLLSIWLRIATALSEIVVGTVAQLLIGAIAGTAALGANDSWIKFLSGAGAIVLTFLAGAELDPVVLRTKWKEATWLGVIAFVAPFLGCAAIAHYVLHWEMRASWLCGIALSTTSVAVVYAVMLELGLNRTDYGKGLLAACFVNDLGTVIVLGLIFAPFTFRTLVFVAAVVVLFPIVFWITPRFFAKYGNRPSELEGKYLLLQLFGMGALATWADSEAVLPAYLIGMVLAGTVGKDHILIRRLRTLTFGLLTPFYFIRAGSFVSVGALIASPLVFIILLAAKMVAKTIGVYPTTKALRYARR
jgi:Kef-type K+ transport system membrane component KefB